MHGFGSTETSVEQKHHLKESLMFHMHSQAPGRGQGILSVIVLDTCLSPKLYKVSFSLITTSQE